MLLVFFFFLNKSFLGNVLLYIYVSQGHGDFTLHLETFSHSSCLHFGVEDVSNRGKLKPAYTPLFEFLNQ